MCQSASLQASFGLARSSAPLNLHRSWKGLWFWILTCRTQCLLETVVLLMHFRYFSATCQL